MYGLVNRSIEQLVTDKFGEAAWDRIRERAGIDDSVFLASEQYPDAMTYSLVGAASAELSLTPEQVLEAFGEHWALRTAREGYGSLLDACGRTLPDFLENLPRLHDRIALMMPKLHPPTFSTSLRTPTSIRLHYSSTREGLAPMVVGLLRGLGTMFGVATQIVHHEPAPGTAVHDFDISWST